MKNLKIYTDKKIFKNSRFKLAKMCAIGTIAVSLLSSCSSNVDNTVYNEVILEPNEHKIVQVVRNMNLWIGKNEKIGNRRNHERRNKRKKSRRYIYGVSK